MTRLFGTDGVRGVANSELTPELAFKLGVYGGEIFKRKNKNAILIGRDTRLSGQILKSALAAGFMSSGFDVYDLGVLPTPAVAYIVKEGNYAGGAVISASHNPFEYNGIKLFDSNGFKLTDDEEDEIEKMIKTNQTVGEVVGENIGNMYSGEELVEHYRDYLKNLLKVDIKGVKIALDLGNGALYKLAPEILSELGADVTAINTEPDGKNINLHCGSTNPQVISKLVVETGSKIGFSFDGDADRIIAADEKGNIINGDSMLAIFGTYMKEDGILENNAVVGTVMTNMGLDEYLNGIGVEVLRTPVGDRYVLEKMVKDGYVVGGEQSGHIIFLKHNNTGDGLATGMHLLNYLIESGKEASELNTFVTEFPQVLVNAKVENKKKFDYLKNENIRCEVEKIESEFGKTGRVVIRPSGTEPLVRVMIEGKDLELIKKSANELAKLIEHELG